MLLTQICTTQREFLNFFSIIFLQNTQGRTKKIQVYFHYFYLHELKEPPPPPAGEEPNPVDPVFDDPNPVDPKVEPPVPPEKQKQNC